MRIVYLVHWAAGEGSGVTQKILAQTESWRRQGAEVRVVAYGRPAVREFAAVLDRAGTPVESWAFGSLRERSTAIRRCAASTIRGDPHVVYFRQDRWHPAIERVAATIPLVVEVNTDDVAEAALGKTCSWAYQLATRGRLLRRAAGAVFVSDELAQMPRFASLRGSWIVIGNGIDLEAASAAPPPASTGPGLVLVAGEPQRWHGVDKLLWLARHRPAWTFHLVGEMGRAAAGAHPPNVRFHGLLHSGALAGILAGADIGIGTLALHRKGLSEASPLKTREYLAAGLPVILGYCDTDFPSGAPFLLRLPNEEDNVRQGLARIDEFVSKWTGHRVDPSAIQHLDVRVKEGRRLEFLRQVARC